MSDRIRAAEYRRFYFSFTFFGGKALSGCAEKA